MTEPNDVFEAMVSAVINADAEFAENNDGLACPAPKLVKAVLVAAKELGYELKPRAMTHEMSDTRHSLTHKSTIWDVWERAYDAAPDLTEGGSW